MHNRADAVALLSGLPKAGTIANAEPVAPIGMLTPFDGDDGIEFYAPGSCMSDMADAIPNGMKEVLVSHPHKHHMPPPPYTNPLPMLLTTTLSPSPTLSW